ncbi:hypothetical protein [Nitrosospira briensis]|uniref:hypothetical protein n=1 Tax=Nitrosospira briensis TaxID=35799 RepID=UPI000468FDF6|nr:hypothetical protein [Nitrosospira briensis]
MAASISKKLLPSPSIKLLFYNSLLLTKYVINNGIGHLSTPDLPVSLPPSSRLLSTADFHRLTDVPLAIEWFANIDNP